MTFEIESRRSGRRYVRYAEVDVDECTRSWGVSPCEPVASRKYYTDNFTDTDATALQDHSSTDISWTKDTSEVFYSDWNIYGNRLRSGTADAYKSYFITSAFAKAVKLCTFTRLAEDENAKLIIKLGITATDFSGDWIEVEITTQTSRDDIKFSLYQSGSLIASSAVFPSPHGGIDGSSSYRINIDGGYISVYANDSFVGGYTPSPMPAGLYFSMFHWLSPFWTGGKYAYVDDLSIYAGELDTNNLADACFNTRSTCQYSQAYDAGTKTYRFFESTEDALELGLDGFPLLASVSTAPTRLTPGKGLGIKSELTLKLNDQRHHDRGTDPYVADRLYDPMTQGTFWGKWLARNKYYTGRTVRLYDGFLTDAGYSSANFRARQYIMDKVDRGKGVTTIKCKDILQKLNTAVAPPPSYVYLVSGITDSQTTINIDTTGEAKFPLLRSDGAVQYIEPFAGSLPFYRADGTSSFIPLTVDNELPFYRADGSYHPIPLVSSEFPIGDIVTVRIGSELITGTVAAGQLTGCTRGARGSTAAAHSTGDTVQKCIVFDNALPTDALTTLFTYAGIESYINTTTWDEQAAKWLGLSRLDGVVSAPEKITSIVERVCVQGTVYPWWDEFTQKIELLAVAPQAPLADLTTYTDELNIIEGSASSEANMREQVTQVLVWYDKIDESDDNSPKNMRDVYPAYDSGAESAPQWDLSRTAQIECDFVKAKGHASAIGTRMIGRLRDGEQVIKFQTDIKETLKTGDEFIINTDASQAADGSQESVRMQIVEMKEMKGGKMYYESIKSAFQGTRYAFIAPDTVSPSYATATEDERTRYCFISNIQGYMSDGTEGYKII